VKRLLNFAVKFLILLAGAAVQGYAQAPTPIPITGNISFVTGGGTPYAGVSIQLASCTAPVSIPGYSVIAPQAYQFQADGTGLINGTIWPNDKIDCNGTTGSSQYQVQFIVNGTPTADPVCYQVTSTQGTWNLNTQQPITCGQAPPAPGDVTYNNVVVNGCLSIKGSSCSSTPPWVSTAGAQMTGPLTTPSINGTLSACGFTGVTADVQIANAFASLPSSQGTVDASCYGTATETLAGPITLIPGQKLVFSPATQVVPASASSTVVNLANVSELDGLTVNLSTYATTYTGTVLSHVCVSGATNIGARVKRFTVVGASGTVGTNGTGVGLSCSTPLNGLAFDIYDDLNIQFLLHPITLTSGGSNGWVNGNQFYRLVLVGPTLTPFTAIGLNNGGLEIRGNSFQGQIEGNAAPGAVGIGLISTGTSPIQANIFDTTIWDVTTSFNDVGVNAVGSTLSGNFDVAPVTNGRDNVFDGLGANTQLPITEINAPNARIILDDTGATNSRVDLQTGGVNKWGLINDTGTSGEFELEDYTSGLYALKVLPGGETTIGETGKIVGTQHNTLDDGAGNAIFEGNISNNNGVVIPGTIVGTTGGGTKIATPTKGIVSLTAGAASVSTTAACSPGAACTYKLTHCSASGTAIGSLSVASISTGVSFSINALSATNTVVAGDTSTVCWEID
jgi:hypothetical protein